MVQASVSERSSAAVSQREPAVAGEANVDSCRRTSVWLLTNAPSPYQAELLTAIAQRPDLDLQVRFMRPESSSGKAVESCFPFVVMAGLAPRSWRDEFRLHPKAVWEAARSRFDCYVLSGLYTSVTFLCCALVLTIRRRRWIVWLERPHPEERKDAAWLPAILTWRPLRWLRRRLHGWLVNRATRCLCIGSAAREAYARHCRRPDNLDVLPYCCRLDRYENVPRDAVEDLKRRYDLDGKTVFLYAGQMIERKGVDVALAAFLRVAALHADVAFLLLGEGPWRGRLMESLSPTIRAKVHFAGQVPQAELAAYFCAAQVFVFPSRHDGWGMVVNEACAAGLPVVATRQTGAARDLVEPGRSGFLVERDDVEGLVQAMTHFLDHPEDIARFGPRSRELVERFSPANGATVFAQSVAQAVR
jgi:glycosyltransferase involved in cell wall biosynthesis